MSPRAGLFRGSELPRLLVLLSALVVGWSLVLWKFTSSPKPVPPGPPPVAAVPPLPPPDDALEFHGIEDKTPLRLVDNLAYARLLERTRATPAGELAATSRRDVFFSHLRSEPQRYRGLPIHLEGIARRILHQDARGSKIFPKGRFYEAWVFTADSHNYPYLLVFEDAPPGLGGGADVWEQVTFDGYFLKLMAYIAADKPRFAPLLVGRIRRGVSVEAPVPRLGISWPIAAPSLALSALTVYILIRLGFQLQKNRGARPDYRRIARPPDLIDPADLAAFLGQPAEAEPARSPDSPDAPGREHTPGDRYIT